MTSTPLALAMVRRAAALALAAEERGNLPIGAVLAIGDEVVAEGANSMLIPAYDPGRHAEIEAIRATPTELWPRAGEMVCYSTLEPCVMCMGTLLLHGVRTVVFGAHDTEGGARFTLPSLPPYYTRDDGRAAMEWIGPVLADLCDPLYARARARFRELPCG